MIGTWPIPVRRFRGERGSATSTAIVFPTFLLLVMLMVNVGYWFHARSVALAAARDGVAEARLQNSSIAAGISAAHTYAAVTGDTALLTPDVGSGGSTATTVCLTVSGKAPSIVPVFSLTVSRHACGPLERITSG